MLTPSNCRTYAVHSQRTSIGTHCSECTKYMDLSRELGGLLGVKFWEVSPLDADSEAPPGYMRHNPLQAGYWHKAWAAMRARSERAVAETH